MKHARSLASVVGALLSLLAAGQSSPVLAQASVIDEITVTAQRREQALQDVPIAVTAYSGEQLQVLQVDQALDMGRLVPNLLAHNNTGIGTANSYSLRGLSNAESIATFDPPVGSYVDDIYVARQNANNFTLFDLDRIEVLRGPQGTLFGRNTTGGAVRVILKKPAEEIGGYLEGSYGEFDRTALRGSVDLPLAENFLTKFSAFWVDEDGYVDNLTTGEEINGEENFGLRAAALWRISDDLSWEWTIDYQDTEDANISNVKQGSRRVSRTGLSESGAPLAGLLTHEKRNFALGNDVEALNLSSVIEWQTGLGRLSFITGWRSLEQEFALDFLDGNAASRAAFGQTPPPYGGFTIANDGDHDQFTQEIKLTGTADRLQYVAGLYYFDEQNETDFGDVFDLDLGLIAPPFAPIGAYIPLVLADRVMENDTDAWAVYLQGDYEFIDGWTLTLGVRYTDEDKDISFTDNQPCAPGNPTCFADANGDGISDNDLSNVNLDNLNSINPAFADIPRRQNEKLWTPRIAVQYEASEDLNYFVSATRGFKSGGWNARGTTPDQLQPFSSEVVWSYELGVRSEWYERRLRVNATAFWTDAADVQIPTAFQPITGQPQFITRNFADLENKGIEIEIVANPVDELTLLANFGWQDAEFRDIAPEIRQQQQDCLAAIAGGGSTLNLCNAGIIDPDGDIADPVSTPEYTLTLGAIYDVDLTADWLLTTSAYLYSVGDNNVVSNGDPDFLADGYTTWNGSLLLSQTAQDWSVELACRNCNDRTMLVRGLAGLKYYQDPRTWSLTVRKQF